MTTRLRPHQIDPGGVADGDYTLSVENGRVVALSQAGAGAPDYVVSVVDGVPLIVVDGDGTLVSTEVPS